MFLQPIFENAFMAFIFTLTFTTLSNLFVHPFDPFRSLNDLHTVFT